MKYMEYKEVEVPSEVQARLAELQENSSPETPATLGACGFFEWITKLSREEGWRPVWQGFNFPYLALEREVNKPREVFHQDEELVPNLEEEVEK
jgi:hypothetical protein